MFVLTSQQWQRVLLEYPAYEARLKAVAGTYKNKRDASTHRKEKLPANEKLPAKEHQAKGARSHQYVWLARQEESSPENQQV